MIRSATAVLALGVCSLAGAQVTSIGEVVGADVAVDGQRQWQAIDGFFAGSLRGLESCGGAILVRGDLPGTAPPASLAVTSSDHGTSWHDSPLAAATLLLGDTSYYWRVTWDTDGSMHVSTTTDCGATWSEAADPSVCLNGNAPDVLWGSRDAPSILYAESRDVLSSVFYVCQSHDEGRSWVPGPRALGFVRAVRGTRWFAVTSAYGPASNGEAFSRLLYSDDQGRTWQSTGLESSVNGLSLIQASANESAMYVIAVTRASRPGAQSAEALWQSIDGGTTWSALASPYPAPSDPTQVRALAVNRLAPERMFLSIDGRIVATSDGGRSWSSLGAGLPGSEVILQFLFDPSLPGRLYGRTSSGLWALDASPWDRVPDSEPR